MGEYVSFKNVCIFSVSKDYVLIRTKEERVEDT